MAQNISIAYLSPLTSSAINNKFALLLGANLVYTGYNAVAGVGTSVSLVRGSDSIQQLFINGVAITEDGDLTNVITIPANSTGSTRTDIIYAQYIHGYNAACTYGIATGTTTLPNGNCCLIATLSVPNGFSSVSSVTITQAQKMLDFNSLKYANRGNAQSTYQIDVNNNGPKLKNNSGTLEIRNAADTGYANVTANAFTSTVATGTAPFVVNSTTKVVNLNSDLLDGYGTATDSTASSVAVRDASGNLSANSYTSTVATGTAPFTVASTTKVTNLNADLLDGYNTGTGSTASTIAVRDAIGNLTTNIFTSTVATGSAPFIVASTTKVANLNADQVDGHDAGNSANNVLVLDASGLVPVANLPTTSASATTTSQTFQLQSGSGGVVLKNNAGVLEVRNSGDSAYADITVNNINIMGSVNEVSTTIVNIQDNTIYLNSNLSSSTAPSVNAGIEVNRGNQTAASLLWNESAQKWYAGLLGSEQAIVLTNDGRIANLSGTGTLAWSYLTSVPTTVSGYGITDALKKTGDTMTGILTSPGITLTGDIINDGNERHFKASGTGINWGYYVNGTGFGAYDWTNSRYVIGYTPSTNTLALAQNGSKITTSYNTLDDGTGNFTASKIVQGTQFKSTVATGTAPLIVTSTTKVTNLNADQLDGVDITGIVQNAGNIISMQGGLDASRPAAGTAGRLYVATDTYQIYRDNGTSWDTVGGVKPVVSTTQPTTGLIDGLVWYNSASGVTKMYLNGAFRDISNSAITFLRNTTTLASDSTSIAIGIPSFNPSSMSMLVYANSTYIEVGDSQDGYSISVDNTTINKITGTWKAGTVFNFVAFATVSGNPNLLGVTCLTSSFTATSNGTTHCLINNSNFNKNTDVLKVYHGNIPLFVNDNYTVNADNVSIDLNYSLNTGDKINYEIWKNIAVSANFSDGSMLAAGSVSNAALASDAKVGSLALLNTNAKSDVVSAVNEVNNELSIINNDLYNSNTSTPALSYGMNSKITNSRKISVSPNLTITGNTIINLLGKDGNCEDTTKWNDINTSHVLDSTNRVFGFNGFKITISATSGSIAKVLSTLDVTKYYCLSAYVKNGNATSIGVTKDAVGGGVAKGGTSVTSTTAFGRAYLKLQPSDLNVGNNFAVTVGGTSGQYAYCDGVMLEQITQAQYNDPTFVGSPYVDSYTCLQNPYIEVRHDNMIINGNGEQGIGWWTDAQQQGSLFDGTYFKIVNTLTDGSLRWIEQLVPVKPSTSYTFSVITKAGTSNSQFIVRYYDINRNAITGTGTDPVSTVITSTSETTISQTLTIPSNTYFVKFYLGAIMNGASGYSYFRQLNMIEGSTTTSQYLPCRLERTVLETKLTGDDSITYNNGEVTGQILWKHRTLYGKDYSWAYDNDFTGFKRVKITAFINNVSGTMVDAMTRYNGDIISNVSACNSLNQFANNSTGTYITVADTDTGWQESINPNNDEVTAFMNGWKATTNNGTRYQAWISVTDGTRPFSTTTTSVANSGSSISFTVSDASMFSVGDLIGATGYMSSTITAISGNTITVSGVATQTPSGTIVFRIDNPTTDTRILIWCKNNVAPNYDGYQLHYKLASPEPISDDNCHIHGDISLLDPGDNYLYLDSGIVLGEVANPIWNGGGAYFINSSATQVAADKLKNKTEDILNIYKDNVNNTSLWVKFILDGLGNGNVYVDIANANFDTNATYTVDYKILATQAPQIGTISCSYSQDIVTAINKIEEAINNKQEHDSILDQIVDKSLYELIDLTKIFKIMPWQKPSSGYLLVDFKIGLNPKKCVPSITINKYTIMCYGSDVTSKFTINNMEIIGNNLTINFQTTDATTIANITSYGAYGIISVTADCRGRI